MKEEKILLISSNFSDKEFHNFSDQLLLWPEQKSRYCEKATKFEKIFHIFWRLLSNVKQVEDFYKFLWPFQKTWTLTAYFDKNTFMQRQNVLIIIFEFEHFGFLATRLWQDECIWDDWSLSSEFPSGRISQLSTTIALFPLSTLEVLVKNQPKIILFCICTIVGVSPFYIFTTNQKLDPKDLLKASKHKKVFVYNFSLFWPAFIWRIFWKRKNQLAAF